MGRRHAAALCFLSVIFLKLQAFCWAHDASLGARFQGRPPILQRAVRDADSPRGTVENPYDILALPRGCSKEDIKPAFRQLARELHPDVPETGNEESFKHLVWAMRELSSEKGRRRWGVPGDLTGASLEEISLEAEDFAFDMRDWPFEELEDLLRLSEEAMDVSEDAMQDVRTTWTDDGFVLEEREGKEAPSPLNFDMIYFNSPPPG